MLSALLDRHDLTDEFPLMVPVLRRFFDLRNLLAHGLVLPVDPDEMLLRVQTVRRGEVRWVKRPLAEVAWLVAAADRVQTDLVRVWAGVVPATEDWHEG